MTLLHPQFLWLAALVPVALLARARRGEPAVRFGPAPFVDGLPKSWRARLLFLPRLLTTAGVLLAIIALARPAERTPLPAESEGVDITLLLDVSSSMSARDLDPARTRLEVAKESATRFIEARPHDRISLVCFARYPDLRCPFTLDHAALAAILANAQLVEPDGTEDATGIGIATTLAAKLLRSGGAKSKVAILLTDGEENVATRQTPAEIAPVQAAQLCRQVGVRVYAIVAGSAGGSGSRGQEPADTTQVRRMAEACGGALFEAPDAATLQAVYAHIDALEKADLKQTRYRVEDRFLFWLLSALGLIALGRLLRATVFEVLP